MSKQVRALAFWLVAAVMTAAPALAFWERSQWSRCSEAATPAAWSRDRCDELEPYRGASGRAGHGGLDGTLAPHASGPTIRSRRGGVARRLG